MGSPTVIYGTDVKYKVEVEAEGFDPATDDITIELLVYNLSKHTFTKEELIHGTTPDTPDTPDDSGEDGTDDTNTDNGGDDTQNNSDTDANDTPSDETPTDDQEDGGEGGETPSEETELRLCLETKNYGVGQYDVIITVNIPDTDFADGIRTEVYRTHLLYVKAK